MTNFIISLLLGMFPEVLYFTMFIVLCKDIKGKRIKLFLLLALGYILLIMLCRYQFIFYVAYIIYSYLVLKFLYKAHISDIFVCSVGLGYMTISAFVGSLFMEFNYMLSYLISRIILFSIFILKGKFNKTYSSYLNLWNRGDNKKIKSITLRNISLVLLNLVIVLFNICAILCTIDSLKY